MKNRQTILTGTALGLLMATAPFAARAMDAAATGAEASTRVPMVVAQAANDDKDKPAQAQKEPEKSPEPPKSEQAPAETAPAPETKSDTPAQAKQAPKKAPQAEEAAPKPEAKPEPAQQPAAKPEADSKSAAGSETPAEAKQSPKAAAEPKASRKAPKAENDARQPTTEKQPDSKKETPAQAKQPPKEAAEPKASGKAPKAENNAQQPAAEKQPDSKKETPAHAKQAPNAEQRAGQGRKAHRRDEKSGTSKPASKSESPADAKQAPNPATKPEPAEAAGTEAKPAAKPEESGQDQQAPKSDARSERDQHAGSKDQAQPENAAPVLDSQKDQTREGKPDGARGHPRNRNARDDNRGDQRGSRSERADQGPPPRSDKAAQKALNIDTIRSAREEKGRRIENPDRRDHRRHEKGDVVKKLGDRIILNFGDRTIVESSGRERIRNNAKDYYEEELPGGRIRGVVTRPNGVQVVTIRNRYGDIIRRSRIGRDGNETVLVYAGNKRNWEKFRDPAKDLPPLRLNIPAADYVLRSDDVRDPDRYYQFLDQPPVEQVDQLYTIDQVKYSSRVRDMVRRVDLDTINFPTGSAEVTQSELPTLEGLAEAMKRLIDKNPGETFLIEGHTDAVGSDDANLALSDRRAESVASALTEAYDIPPENLFTQGYGEQYLKVDTEGASRQNRRVAIRRITPLVSPVAQNQ